MYRVYYRTDRVEYIEVKRISRERVEEYLKNKGGIFLYVTEIRNKTLEYDYR